MRFYGLALLASAAVLGACGGGEKTAADTTKAPPAAARCSGCGRAGRWRSCHDCGDRRDASTIKMIGDDKGYRFEPADITIKSGDAVKFVMVTGGPHNVAFDPATVPADSKAQLDANMDGKMSELSSPHAHEPERGVHDLVRWREAGHVSVPLHAAPRHEHEGHDHGAVSSSCESS